LEDLCLLRYWELVSLTREDVPDEDWFSVSGSDLLQSRVYFRIQMILRDDEDDTHLIVNHCCQSFIMERDYRLEVHV
jgi:hypothetical protein